MGGGYEEDPKDKAARLRERRITDLERMDAAQDTASGLTSDIRAVYGMKGMKMTMGKAPVAPAATASQTGYANVSRKSDNYDQWGR